MITNAQTGTNVHEIAPRIYRINTPLAIPGQEFSFNQYLVAADEPLLFHTGPKKMFPLVAQAIAAVLPVRDLRYVSFSHFEADECGSLVDFLAVAPNAEPLTGHIAKMVSVDDVSPRAARALADGEALDLGSHRVRWFDAPHVPHGWECGFLMEDTTRTLLSGDLFTQPGRGEVPLTGSDILGPSEAFRKAMDYYAHAPQTQATLERLAQQAPQVLACMHGSAWQGDGASLLRALAASLADDGTARERKAA